MKTAGEDGLLLLTRFPVFSTPTQQQHTTRNFCPTLTDCLFSFPTSLPPQASRELTVDDVSADRFLTAFRWDEAKHPARRPLRETVEKLQEGVAKVDDEFKVKASEYAMVKSQLNGLTRKAGGSLATRNLGELVQGTDVRPLCVFFRFFFVSAFYSRLFVC